MTWTSHTHALLKSTLNPDKKKSFLFVEMFSPPTSDHGLTETPRDVITQWEAGGRDALSPTVAQV